LPHGGDGATGATLSNGGGHANGGVALGASPLVPATKTLLAGATPPGAGADRYRYSELAPGVGLDGAPSKEAYVSPAVPPVATVAAAAGLRGGGAH
jgi:hypothetical protein